LQLTIGELVQHFKGRPVDKVAGIESRGFIVGGALAYQLRAGFVPLRKRGKLPAETLGQDYELEYGADRLEMHVDGVAKNERILLVDDLIATGGTAEAAVKLIGDAGAEIVGCAFIIELPQLGGRKRLEALGHTVFSLVAFEGH